MTTDRRKKHAQPMQPIDWDGAGVIRFKENAVVRWMLDAGGRGARFSLNTIARMPEFSREDREQLAQLIGYSVSGFGELGYVRPRVLDAADAKADRVYKSDAKETARQMRRKAKLMAEASARYAREQAAGVRLNFTVEK